MLSLSPGPKAKKICQNLKLRGGYFRVPTNFLKTEVGLGEGEKNSANGLGSYLPLIEGHLLVSLNRAR
jgi:hypothetical protein